MNKSRIAAVLVIILLLAGCNQALTGEQAGTLSPSTTTPSITPTNTPAPTMTIMPTWTPVATLAPDVLKQNLIELFSTNGGCEFPCWWGIRPGDPIQSVYALAPLVGQSPGDNGVIYAYQFSLDEFNMADMSIKFNYHPARQIIRRIDVSLGSPARFNEYHAAFDKNLSIASILNWYGKPTNILFYYQPPSDPEGGTNSVYELELVYESTGFIIRYEGYFENQDNPIQLCTINLTMCPAEYTSVVSYVTLTFASPEMISEIANLNLGAASMQRPLEEWTTMTQDEFYQAFSNPDNNSCIEISQE